MWIFRQVINEKIAGGKRKKENKGCGCPSPERVCGIGEGDWCAYISWETCLMCFEELWWRFGVV